MPIPTPNANESKQDYMMRCMSNEKMKSEYDQEQRIAVCSSSFTELADGQKISFDYDGTLSTTKGTELAKRLIKTNTIYIISARSSEEGMLSKAKEIGITRIYATGSNKAKIEKIKELGIDKHYDNNKDVVNALNKVGILFE